MPGVWLRASLRGYRDREQFAGVDTYCQFVGYPRSGHTLVAALLNAHPEIVISNEAGILDWSRRGLGRSQLISLIVEADRRFAGRGYRFLGFDYRVPGESQGRFYGLRVVGDKDAARDTRLLHRHPDLLHRLADRLRVRVRVLHVVRNPFDMLATSFNRLQAHGRPIGMDEAIGEGAAQLEQVDAITRAAPPGAAMVVRHEELVREPRQVLAEVCGFLGVEPSANYLDACAAVVFPEPHRSRTSVAWTGPQIESVQRLICRWDFLRGYAFEEP